MNSNHIKMKLEEIQILETTAADLDTIRTVETSAFGHDKEAALTVDLLTDTSAMPHLSLLAFHNGRAVGHILFTRAHIEGADPQPLVHILAPLAVIPEYQKLGIGGLLISKGLELLKERGTKLTFVLGHKEYYPRHGFVQNAQGMGYPPPYPVPAPAEYAEYWMLQRLTDGELPKGRILCAAVLCKPEYWRE